MGGYRKYALAFVAAICALDLGAPARADGMDLSLYGLSAQRTRVPYYSWMSPDVRKAWRQGYLGQGSTMYFGSH